MKAFISIFLTAFLIGFISCESSEPAPNKDYFLKFLGNDGDQSGVDFVVNSDGSVVILGNSRASVNEDQDLYVAKLDAQAKLVWEIVIGESLDDDAKDIELLPDGNLIVLANSQISDSNNDVLLIKLDQNGTEIARVRQGLTESNGTTPKNENAKSITVISDGYIVAGSTSSIPEPAVDKSDYMYMRFLTDLSWVSDASGNWKNSSGFGSSYQGEDAAIKVIEKDANTYYVFGYSNLDDLGINPTADFNFTVFGLSGTGNQFSQTLFAGTTNYDEKMTGFSDASAQSLVGYLMTGTSQNLVDGDIYLIKLPRNLTFQNSDFIVSKQIGLNVGKSTLQRSFNDSPASDNFFVATEKLNGTSLDILLAKLDNLGNRLFEVSFGSKEGDDFAAKVLELGNGRILLLGTMTMGGVVDGQKKIAFMKLNSEGKLAP